MPDTTTTKRTSTAARDASGFTEDEKSAMKERAKELKASRKGKSPADSERDLLAKIEAMEPADRAMAERVHAIVRAAAPDLVSTTWYGMPAYAKGGKVICFFQPAAKFKARYATFGFNEDAKLDDGTIW